MRKPTNFKELRKFLGCCNSFRDYIRRFADKTVELTNGLKRKKFMWTDKMNNEFNELKKDLKTPKKLF